MRRLDPRGGHPAANVARGRGSSGSTDDGGTAEGPLTSDAYPSGVTVGTNAAPTSADKTGDDQ